MKQFSILLRLQLRRMLRRPSFFAALLLPLLLLLLAGLFLPRSQEATVQVGVLLEEHSPLAEEFYEILLALETPPVQFVRAESREQLEEMVAATLWECAYVLPAGFTERVARYDLSEIFTRVSSPASSMQILSNAALQAALLDLIGDDVAAQYLSGMHVIKREDFFALIDAGTIQTADFYAYFDVESLHDAAIVSLEAHSIEYPLKAILALSLFLLFFLAAVSFSADMRNGFFSRLRPICSPFAAFLSAPLALFLLSLLEGALLLSFAAFFEPIYAQNLAWEASALLCYLLYLAALTVFISSSLRLGRVFFAALPFFLLSSLILLPIFVDLTRFFPFLYPLSLLFPPVLYFRAAGGSVLLLLLMLLLAVLFALLGRKMLARPKAL